MAGAHIKQRDLLLIFFTDMKFNDYIDLITRSNVAEVDSLFCARQVLSVSYVYKTML